MSIEELKFAQRDHYKNLRKETVIHNMEHPLWKARMASTLIEKWGMVVGADGGEDSAGRHKMREMTAPEIVDRACTIADLAVDAFRERGWTVMMPDEFTNEEGKDDDK